MYAVMYHLVTIDNEKIKVFYFFRTMNNLNVDHTEDNIAKQMEKIEKTMNSMFGSKYYKNNKNKYNLGENIEINNVELSESNQNIILLTRNYPYTLYFDIRLESCLSKL